MQKKKSRLQSFPWQTCVYTRSIYRSRTYNVVCNVSRYYCGSRGLRALYCIEKNSGSYTKSALWTILDYRMHIYTRLLLPWMIRRELRYTYASCFSSLCLIFACSVLLIDRSCSLSLSLFWEKTSLSNFQLIAR